MWIHVRVCMCIYICIHTYTYVCVYIYAYADDTNLYPYRPELSELYLHSQLLPQINMPKSQLCEIAPPRASKVV